MDITDETPIQPIYDFNAPGQPILLYRGLLGGLSGGEYNGTVELSCGPKTAITWNIDSGGTYVRHSSAELSLLLHRSRGDAVLPALMRGNNDGWSNGAEFGDKNSRLTHVIAHWFNLPNWHSPKGLLQSTTDGSQTSWMGRWPIEIEDWRIIFDVRPHYSEVMQNLHKSRVFVMTHVMALSRIDGEDFPISAAESVLSALQMGISFALGRFVAPMLPVGFSANGDIAWESWRPSFCDPARSINSGWWHHQDLKSLEKLLTAVIKEFSKPDRQTQLRMQLAFAVSAIKDEGFVEQRITIGTAGLEHIAWQELVLSGRMSKNQYDGKSLFNGDKLSAHARLRLLLEDASVSLDVAPSLLPVAAKYIAEMRNQGKELDGADLVTRIRNKLVHPQEGQNEVYRLDGLVSDVWRLTCHYLSSLILHSLDYRGSARDMRRRNGSVGDIAAVPWASEPG